jgi:hypothetical protein
MARSQPNGTPQVNGTAHQTNGPVKIISSYAAKHKLPAHFIGGNHLAAAPAGSVKDFIASNDGHTVITSVSLRKTEESRASLTDASE